MYLKKWNFNLDIHQFPIFVTSSPFSKDSCQRKRKRKKNCNLSKQSISTRSVQSFFSIWPRAQSEHDQKNRAPLWPRVHGLSCSLPGRVFYRPPRWRMGDLLLIKLMYLRARGLSISSSSITTIDGEWEIWSLKLVGAKMINWIFCSIWHKQYFNLRKLHSTVKNIVASK